MRLCADEDGGGGALDQKLGLKVLGIVMGWTDDVATAEFAWLKLIAGVKYDGYRDFRAGMRFIESLATWLQQFDSADRPAAYEFVRTRLVYLGPAEMSKLVEQFYPRHVRRDIELATASATGVPGHLILANPEALVYAETLRRSTIFMALSDGARLDGVRHSNVGLLSNEQMATATQIDTAKWKDIRDELRKDIGDASALVRQVYLIDDFAGTGTSFIRKKLDDDGAVVIEDGNPKWTGKLRRFRDSVLKSHAELEGELLADDWVLYVHHYVGTSRAVEHMSSAVEESSRVMAHDYWASDVRLSYGMILHQDFPLHQPKDQDFMRLTQHYYDTQIEDRHTAVGGTRHMGLGYGGCALPLVLDHNTPNNSIALLWAESETPPATGDRAMTPLFRRRKRHTS